jgi:hypothetical protein
MRRMKDMAETGTVKILKVHGEPRPGKPYENKKYKDTIHPIEFSADVEADGRVYEAAQLSIGSKTVGTNHPLVDVVMGCKDVVCYLPPRTSPRGTVQFSIVISDTKNLHGLGFQGGNRGGGGSSVGMEVGAAMHDAAALVSGTLKPGCSVTELEEVLYATAKMCLRVSQKLKDEATPNTGNSSGVTESGGSVSAGGHNDKLNAIREALKGQTAINESLKHLYDDGGKALCMETWEQSGGNARLFLQNMDSALFPPEPTTADEVNDSMPF